MGILLDWWASFDPEAGYEEYLDSVGQRVEVVAPMRGTARGARHVLEQVARTSEMRPMAGWWHSVGQRTGSAW
jgi:hypothetical protein